MQVTGYIANGAGERLRGAFGILNAAGDLLAGPTDTEPDGSFELSASEGESVFFSAPGYVTKIFPVPLASAVVVLSKPVTLATYALVAGAAYLVFFSRGKKKRVGGIKVDQADVKTIFWIVGGVIAFDTIKKILEALGFWKDADARSLDQAATDPNSFWNPSFWQRSQQYSYAIDTPTAEAYAKTIHGALGWFNDDESAIMSVFHQLRTKANISFLAYVYANMYGEDLLATLRGGIWPMDGISDADLAAINAYGKSLPDF